MYQHTFTITSDGTTDLEIEPGEYAVVNAGTWGGGTLSVRWNDGTNSVEFPCGSFTDDGGQIFANPTPKFSFSMTGSSSPSVIVTISKISQP